MAKLDRTRVLLSVQRALLGAIAPEIRAIDVSWSDNEIRLRLTVDASDDYDMTDLANDIEAEIEGDFLPDARVRSEVTNLPKGNPLPAFDQLERDNARVFARRED